MHILDDVVPFIEEYSPHLIVIEDYGPINRMAGKITQRAEMIGVIKHHCLRLFEIPMILVRPNSLKQYATGNGSANKDRMMQEAARRGYYPDSHDEADAFFLCMLGKQLLSGVKVPVLYERINPVG